ncbi:hypothetical protein DRN69_08685 [Candidatus Pacearchaeota archaeon]|nr:MAG: hypothetical protein DRN69_08685 [Candidatus Pacearchaeota archaeon]
MKKMKIYVAGPLSGNNAVDYINNMKRMLDISLKIYKKGHLPYVPCLDFLMGLRSRKNWKHEQYYNFNLGWIEVCDAFYYIGSSRGADIELEHAKKLGLKIFYRLDEIKDIRSKKSKSRS